MFDVEVITVGKYLDIWRLNPYRVGQFCRDYEIHQVGRFFENQFIIPVNPDIPLIRNFNKCKLYVTIWNDISENHILKNIFEIISDIFNLTLSITYIDESYLRSQPDIMFDLLRNKTTLSTSHYCATKPIPGVSIGLLYSVMKVYMVFGPRKSYNVQNILLNVFNIHSYLLIGFTYLLVAFTSILISKVSDFDYIKKVLDIYGSFFGNPMKIPKNLKTALIGTMILGLLIRTVFQAVIFKTLTLKIVDDHPSSFEELKNGNFKMLIPNVGFDTQHFSDSLKGNVFKVETSKFTTNELLQSINNFSYRTGIFAEKFSIFYHLENKLIDPASLVIRESVLTTLKCIYFPKHHHTNNLFYPFIQDLTENGLIRKWSTPNWKKFSLEINKAPKQIILDDIYKIFVLIIFGWMISTFALLMEIFNSKLNG